MVRRFGLFILIFLLWANVVPPDSEGWVETLNFFALAIGGFLYIFGSDR